MIPTVLMTGAILILVVSFIALRRARQRQEHLEKKNEAMQVELDRHRQTLRSILRELQNP